MPYVVINDNKILCDLSQESPVLSFVRKPDLDAYVKKNGIDGSHKFMSNLQLSLITLQPEEGQSELPQPVFVGFTEWVKP